MARITKAQREALNWRMSIIREKTLELELMKNEYKYFNEKMLKDLSLDPEKKYKIDEDGELTEIKEEKTNKK